MLFYFNTTKREKKREVEKERCSGCGAPVVLKQRCEKSEKSVDELADQRQAFALIGLGDLVA